MWAVDFHPDILTFLHCEAAFGSRMMTFIIGLKEEIIDKISNQETTATSYFYLMQHPD